MWGNMSSKTVGTQTREQVRTNARGKMLMRSKNPVSCAPRRKNCTSFCQHYPCLKCGQANEDQTAQVGTRTSYVFLFCNLSCYHRKRDDRVPRAHVLATCVCVCNIYIDVKLDSRRTWRTIGTKVQRSYLIAQETVWSSLCTFEQAQDHGFISR